MTAQGPAARPPADTGPGAAAPWRVRLYAVVFESDTPAGRAFDLALIVAIVAAIGVLMLDSMAAFSARHDTLLRTAEWTLTTLFTIEYLLRLAAVGRPLRYATSFLGAIDLVAVVAGYVGLLVPGAQYGYAASVRVLRVLRIFRILKLFEYTGEAGALARALAASRARIGVFVFATLTLVVCVGTLMYVVEGPTRGFTSVPRSMYWAIVTLTTVGYGDISPRTDVGQFLASLVMLLGYGIIAVPTGIVTAELTTERVLAERQARGPVEAPPPARTLTLPTPLAVSWDARVERATHVTLGGVPRADARPDAASDAQAPDAHATAPRPPAPHADARETAGDAPHAAPSRLPHDRGATSAAVRCARCGAGGHASDAAFCRRCGAGLARGSAIGVSPRAAPGDARADG